MRNTKKLSWRATMALTACRDSVEQGLPFPSCRQLMTVLGWKGPKSAWRALNELKAANLIRGNGRAYVILGQRCPTCGRKAKWGNSGDANNSGEN
jgi:hypothetical protein